MSVVINVDVPKAVGEILQKVNPSYKAFLQIADIYNKWVENDRGRKEREVLDTPEYMLEGCKLAFTALSNIMDVIAAKIAANKELDELAQTVNSEINAYVKSGGDQDTSKIGEPIPAAQMKLGLEVANFQANLDRVNDASNRLIIRFWLLHLPLGVTKLRGV